jgi:hypothetical protein
VRRQRSIKDRRRLYSGIEPRIDDKIMQLAARFDCSKSFVSNTLLAKALNISVEEHYDDTTTVREFKKRA